MLTLLLTKLLDRLTDLALDDLKPLLKRLTSKRGASIAFLAAVLAMAAVYHSGIPDSLDWAHHYTRVVLAGRQRLPLNRTARNNLLEASSKLQAALESDFGRMGDAEYEPWPIAQVTVALDSLNARQRLEFIKYIQKERDTTCTCWRVAHATGYPPHIPATAWILFAVAELREPPPPAAVDSLISWQKAQGWWSFYRTESDDSQFASTYATAWAVLALQRLTKMRLLDPKTDQAAKDAILRGYGWLLQKQIPSRPRWRDYPDTPSGNESESISGLVLYTLHTVGRDSLRALDRMWLQHLPDQIPRPSDAPERSDMWVYPSRKENLDPTRHLRLPWLLLATVEAYPNGSGVERTRAIAWIDALLSNPEIPSTASLRYDFERAETRIALREVLSRTTTP